MNSEIVLAGGCFWCTEAVFERIYGVLKVAAGFAGGTIKNPAYREVRTGRTGHAEAVEIEYDSDKVDFKTLLEVFFAMHNPTTLNQQDNDKGTQYRSAILYTNEEQKQIAEDFINYLNENHVFEDEIVTEISPLSTFYKAEENHQKYYSNNKDQPYCQIIIEPKIDKIKKLYSDKLK